MNKLSFHVPDF